MRYLRNKYFIFMNKPARVLAIISSNIYMYIADTHDLMVDDKVALCKCYVMLCKCGMASQSVEYCDMLRRSHFGTEDLLAKLRDEHCKEASLGTNQGIAQNNKIIYIFHLYNLNTTL